MAQAQAEFEPEPFGKYILVDHIATGGMAEIFKAKRFGHGGFESLLVIKRILPHIGAKPDFVEMFIDEAKISVALQHPNIVRVFDFGKIGDVDEHRKPRDNYFIAMECVEGKDVRYVLRQLARRKRFLPDRFAAFIAFEAAKGLHYAHQKSDLEGQPYGVVHRDVSPSNILVSYEGEVKVVDFGIAKAESNVYETRDGMLKGKFEYMSPEQAVGGDVDGRSDVFSLGIVLYEMLTSRRLFKTGSDADTLKLIRDKDVAPPSVLKPDVPPALEAIALKALRRNRAERYGSAQEMADDLREYLFPASTDTMREELATFLEELFGAEKVVERERLKVGSERAAQLSEQGEWDWDGHTGTMSQTAATAVKLIAPTIAGGALATIVLLLSMAAGVYVYQEELRALVGVQEASTRGTLDLLIIPDAKVYVDGELRGEGGTVTVPQLPPGVYTVRLEAEGHETLEKTVEVAAGDTLRLAERLTAKVAAPTPTPVRPTPAPDAGDKDGETDAPSGPPVLMLRSEPSGATVLVDGTEVGTTPLSWRGKAGATHSVEMRMAGFQSASQAVSGLDDGERRTVSLTLTEAPKSGTLTVVLVGGGWANVYVDGTKLAKTAPLRDVEIPAGSHEVRLVNEAAGLDVTQTVSVEAGKAATVRVAAD
jgi:serine/threonine protein kinase